MKTFTVTVPDNVKIVTATFISIDLFNTWAVNSCFKPVDGEKVTVIGGETKDSIPRVEYEEEV